MDDTLRQTIADAVQGDQEAFEELIRLYSRLVFAQAMAVVRHHEEAEDVVQDTFIKAFKYRRLLREPEAFSSWILAITRNVARDRLRRRRPVVTLADEAGDVPDTPAVVPGWSLQRREGRACLAAALALLPEHHRLALELRYIDGLDYPSIQSRLGVSNGALRGILDRARGGLRRLLTPMRDDTTGDDRP